MHSRTGPFRLKEAKAVEVGYAGPGSQLFAGVSGRDTERAHPSRVRCLDTGWGIFNDQAFGRRGIEQPRRAKYTFRVWLAAKNIIRGNYDGR